MPKSVVSLIAACLLAFSLRAQTSVFPSVSGGLSNATFLSPPSAPALNAAYLFTDASATGACSGGGSSYAICAWNGSSFGAIAGTSTGLGDPGSNGVVFRNGSGTSIPATATQMAGPHFCSDAGAADSYACNLSPAIAAYVTGTFYWFKANTANTGAASINFNAKGALTIKKMIGGITTDLSTGDIVVGQWVGGFYDGTNFQMATQLGTAVDTTSTQTLTNKTLDGVSPATMAFVDPTSSVQTQINGKVGTATTVNGHALSSNVTVTNADLGAVPTTTTVNGHALSSNVTVTNADLGSVPTTTTVNGHALSSNVTVTTADVSALGDPGSNGVVKRTAANVSAAATAGTDYSAPGTNETTTGNRTLTGLLDASGGTHTLPAKVGLAASKPATCTTGEIYFATDATAGQQIYECSSTNTWTQQLNSGGGSGSVVLTSGSGAPVASCTAPSSSNLAIYTDTTNNQAYYCSATNTWRRLLSVNPTDPLGIAGTTQSQAAAITQNGGSVPASSILCYGDATANTLICLDSSSNAFEMVKGIANPSDTQVVNYIDQSGIQHRIAQTGAGLGDPAANGVVRRTALNTTAVTTIPSDATQFLNGAATPAFAAVKDSDLSTSNVTTNNATTAKHGFVPILPNDATKYYDGTGAFSVPAGTGLTDFTTGTSKTFSLNSGYFECTGTCTITMPTPAAGQQFCIRNANNVATVITFAAIGSSARYENTASTAYGTAGTGTLVSGGAIGDRICLVGKDSTHYDIFSFNGTWTAN